MNKLLISALLVTFVLGAIALPALAKEQGKMERAAKNTVLGWTEIPKAVTQVTKDTDNPFLGITIGLLKGIANAFARTTSGAADTLALPAGGAEEPAIKDSMIDLESSSKTK